MSMYTHIQHKKANTYIQKSSMCTRHKTPDICMRLHFITYMLMYMYLTSTYTPYTYIHIHTYIHTYISTPVVHGIYSDLQNKSASQNGCESLWNSKTYWKSTFPVGSENSQFLLVFRVAVAWLQCKYLDCTCMTYTICIRAQNKTYVYKGIRLTVNTFRAWHTQYVYVHRTKHTYI